MNVKDIVKAKKETHRITDSIFNVDKARNAATGIVPVTWLPQAMRFADKSDDTPPAIDPRTPRTYGNREDEQ